jgi:CelD/BcsL family acetyltransferase involved in cellulose biosynthesis
VKLIEATALPGRTPRSAQPVPSRPAADGAGRRRRRRDGTSLTVTHVRSHAEAAALADDWRALYRVAGKDNPFAAPEWLLPWARHFVPEPDLDIFAVYRDRKLVGVAPWYYKRHAPLPPRLQLLGSGRHDALTELPQVLTTQGEARSVLRAVIREWARQAGDWAWLELPLTVDQGWFEPEWLAGTPAERGLVEHKTTRAAVVLDLPSNVSALHLGLKRNLLEATHRARNRLDRSGEPWVITAHRDAGDIVSALPVLARLHAARAQLAGHRNHPDQLGLAARRSFLGEALDAMAARRQAQILTLDVAGAPVAAQLVLTAPDGSFLSLSGVDPAWWHASPVTLLQLHAAQLAVEQGHAVFNLSVGPSVSKLRWSEQVRQHPEFLVCGPRWYSRLAYAGYRMAAAAAAVHRESRRHQTAGPGKSDSQLAEGGDPCTSSS